MVLGTPTRCSISYRFRGSPSLITPHLFPISNYASASPFWKSTGSYRFPNTPFCLTQVCLSSSRQWFRLHDLNELNIPASIHLTSCATGDPHQAGVFPIFRKKIQKRKSRWATKRIVQLQKNGTSLTRQIFNQEGSHRSQHFIIYRGQPYRICDLVYYYGSQAVERSE